MVNTIKNKIKDIYRKVELSKINYLNHKFKKYIVKCEENKNELKIFNSNGDYKIVKNTIANKVKVMEIIKDHKKEIDNKINYYEGMSEDNKIVILSSAFLICVLACVFIFSFFVGSYIFLVLSLITFSITLSLFSINTYKIILLREEVKRLKLIKDNKDILNDNELKDLLMDSFVILKKIFYNVLSKIIDVFDGKKVKS